MTVPTLDGKRRWDGPLPSRGHRDAAHRPVHQPGDPDEVHDHPQGPVPKVVVRPAMAPRTVAYRHLDDAASLPEQERAEEPMHAVEQRQAPCQLAGEEPYGTAGVADGLAQHEVADPVGDATDQPLRPGVFPPDSPAQCGVVPGEFVPEQDEVGRIVLQVRVQGRDPVASSRMETGGDRRRLPDIRLQADGPELGIGRRQVLEDPRGSIG